MSDITARAAHAERLLGDPILQEAFAAVRADMIALWTRSPEDATDKRESYFRNILAVDRVFGKLKQFADDAKLAEAAIERARNLAH